MQLIFIFFLVKVCLCWVPVTQSRIIESENIITQDEYVIIANASFSIHYKALEGYKGIYLMFDTRTANNEALLLIKVNGVRRNQLLVLQEFQEIHMEFEHQAQDVTINFEFEQGVEITIRNFNLFIQECPKNCKFCLSGSCQLQLFEQCDKLKYKDKCVDECPEGTLVEYRQCIPTIFNHISPIQSFLSKSDYTIQKFGDQKRVDLHFEYEFLGIVEIVFKCYGEFQRHYNSLLKIADGINYTETIHPFLQIYYNIQSYHLCEPNYDLNCTQVKSILRLNLLKSNTLTISSYSRAFSDNAYWGIDSIKIYEKKESKYECNIENCQSCSYNNECQICQTGYIFYENKCIKQCPYFTIYFEHKCIDISDDRKDFLIKLVSPFQRRDQVIGEQSFDLNESINFRYENETTFIGGGLLDRWRRTTFQKQLILDKHYAIRIMFNISIENSTKNNDNFFYTIDGRTFSIYKNSTYVDHTLIHSKNILNMNLGCKISSDGRCVISNYYFMIMKCAPLCQSCSGPEQSDCKLFSKSIVNFDYKTNKCEDGFYLNDYGCSQCSRGCKSCSSSSKCIQCLDTKEGEFYCKPYL